MFIRGILRSSPMFAPSFCVFFHPLSIPEGRFFPQRQEAARAAAERDPTGAHPPPPGARGRRAAEDRRGRTGGGGGGGLGAGERMGL